MFLSFKEQKEMANGCWVGLFEMAAVLWLTFTDFVRSVVNHDWRKEWNEIVLSPQNRQEAKNFYYLFRFFFEGMFYLVSMPFVMMYVAVENGTSLALGRKKPVEPEVVTQ